MQKNILITIILVAVVGGGAFFGGMKYQQSKQQTSFGQFRNGQRTLGAGGQQQNGARAGGGQIVGEIIGQDDKSITVKLQNGSSKIVLLSDTTTINKAAEGTKSDLKIGERVGVFGTSNADGTLVAQNVQLNPMVRGTATSGGIPRP